MFGVLSLRVVAVLGLGVFASIAILSFVILHEEHSRDVHPIYSSSSNHIPKILHFVWIDVDLNRDDAPPDEMGSNIERWRELNPTWTVRVWSSSKVVEAFPDFAEEIRSYRVASWQSDLIRYRILYEYGGLYLDTDIYPLRPLPESITNESIAVCQRPLAFKDGPCREVCNGVIGVPASLPTMFRVLETSLWRSRKIKSLCPWCPFIYFVSGPPLLTGIVIDKFKILPTHTFLPCWHEDKSKCVASNFISNAEVIGMHTWKHSWKKDSEWFSSKVVS